MKDHKGTIFFLADLLKYARIPFDHDQIQRGNACGKGHETGGKPRLMSRGGAQRQGAGPSVPQIFWNPYLPTPYGFYLDRPNSTSGVFRGGALCEPPPPLAGPP